MSLLQITIHFFFFFFFAWEIPTCIFHHYLRLPYSFSGRQSKSDTIIYTPGIYTCASTFLPICHDIITSILCSKTFKNIK